MTTEPNQYGPFPYAPKGVEAEPGSAPAATPMRRSTKVVAGVATGVFALAAIGAIAGGGDDATASTGDGSRTTTVDEVKPSTKTPTTAAPVSVPNVLGMSADSATQSLEAMGMKVKVVGDTGNPEWKVIAQTPEASSKAPAGSRVTLTVGENAEQKAAREAAEAAQAAAAAEAAAAAAAAEEAARGTVSQQNARRSAEGYLRFTAFSRTGLIGQLEFEGFSTEDATWAVDGMSVDWNAQAAQSAKHYLEFTAFSHSGLVDQLVFEGFTREQAEYGVSQTGL